MVCMRSVDEREREESLDVVYHFNYSTAIEDFFFANVWVICWSSVSPLEMIGYLAVFALETIASKTSS